MDCSAITGGGANVGIVAEHRREPEACTYSVASSALRLADSILSRLLEGDGERSDLTVSDTERSLDLRGRVGLQV